MIHKQEMFIIYCDKCEMPYGNGDTDVLCLYDMETAKEVLATAISDEEWNEDVEGKHYCETCSIEMGIIQETKPL